MVYIYRGGSVLQSGEGGFWWWWIDQHLQLRLSHNLFNLVLRLRSLSLCVSLSPSLCSSPSLLMTTLSNQNQNASSTLYILTWTFHVGRRGMGVAIGTLATFPERLCMYWFCCDATLWEQINLISHAILLRGKKTHLILDERGRWLCGFWLRAGF